MSTLSLGLSDSCAAVTRRVLSCLLVLGLPYHATPAAQVAGADQLQALGSEESARESLMKDVRAYQANIEKIEDEAGAYASGLSEQLLGLGLALQRNGAHAEAINVFKRGAHLARINEGLYSNRQMALLQGEIASLIALNEFASADERQRYLYRVQAKTLSDTTRGQALMQHAVWQRQAYEAGIGEEPYTRLIRMWSLYRLALTEFADNAADDSPMLLPPLYGMLQSQYLISGFVGETHTGRFRIQGTPSYEENQQLSYSNQSYKQGVAVIRAIHDVRVAQPDSTLRDRTDAILLLADWHFWHGKRTEALEAYAALDGELAELEGAQHLREVYFAEPASLPAVVGVRGLPEPLAEQDGGLLLEFGVTERGRVVDLQRLDDDPANDEKAASIMRRVRQTLFRPRISDGMPVRTEGLVRAYDTASW